MPRIETKYDKNVFFFKNAAYDFGNMEEYTKKLMNVCINEDELFIQLSQQIHVESIIIDKKFKSVQRALKFFALSFIFVILIILFWLTKL